MALISVAELAEQLDDLDVVVCDVRFHLADHDQGRREYDTAHLPGARFVDLHHELAGSDGGGRHPLPPVEAFGELLGRLGVKPSSLVVAYDSAGGATASRLWWMLRSIGHGRVRVLDGGYPAWVAAGLPVTTDRPAVTPSQYPTAPEWTGVVDADAVAQSIEFGGMVVDARAPERFRGETEPIDARAGHIPGAINRFHADTIGPDGLHLSTPELVEHFAGVGTNAIVYCGSGVTACHTLLAMSTVGLQGARLYPGSWSEWSSDDDRPVATGD
jgi:thiosulfate/3-mercaptopyruvate sulfurtransferase